MFRGESPAQQKQLEKVALAHASTIRDFCERYFAEVIQRIWSAGHERELGGVHHLEFREGPRQAATASAAVKLKFIPAFLFMIDWTLLSVWEVRIRAPSADF